MIITLDEGDIGELTPLNVDIPQEEVIDISQSSQHLGYYSWLSISYDVLTILISFGDVVTDVIVTYYFYVDGRMAFFIGSVVILCLAHIAYCFLFSVIFTNRSREFTLTISNFFIGCFIAPLVSLLIYLTADRDSSVTRYLNGVDCLRSRFKFGEQNRATENASKADNNLIAWLASNIIKHAGFLTEGFIEAIPEALLQIIAIVYYNNINYISVVSISLSMLSVIIKSLMLIRAIEWKTFVFLWLCAITDFFNVFCVITWAFYDNSSFRLYGVFGMQLSLMGNIEFCNLLFLVAPIVVLPTMTFVYALMAITCQEARIQHWSDICKIAVAVVIMALVLCVGMLGLFMTFMTFFYIYFAGLVYDVSVRRFSPSAENAALFLKFTSFIMNSHNDLDAFRRVVAVNRTIALSHCQRNRNRSAQKFYDSLSEFTESDDYETKYGDNYWQALRTKSKDALATTHDMNPFNVVYDRFVVKQWNNFKGDERKFTFMAICVLSPVYILSRVYTLIFPYLLIVIIFANKWYLSVNAFQWTMLGIALLLQWTLIVLFAKYIFWIHFYQWHIYPGRRDISVARNGFRPLMASESIEQTLLSEYREMQSSKFAKLLLYAYIGKEIADIILGYMKNIELSRPENKTG